MTNNTKKEAAPNNKIFTTEQCTYKYKCKRKLYTAFKL